MSPRLATGGLLNAAERRVRGPARLLSSPPSYRPASNTSGKEGCCGPTVWGSLAPCSSSDHPKQGVLACEACIWAALEMLF